MVPTVRLPPAAPFTDHVTDVFADPVTAAANCSVAPVWTLADSGESVTATGAGMVFSANPAKLPSGFFTVTFAGWVAMPAASAPAGRIIEIGTSAGYSTLWLILAARATRRRVTTFEIDAARVELARATFAAAAVADLIDLVQGDAVAHVANYDDIGFCFLDAEKDVYEACYELVVPRMVSGGILVADNAISHEAVLRPMLARALRDDRVDSVLVPIGQGNLVCRKK
jgi:predicted O-methyltransferase YrrM